jgi:uncharacterized protein (TIRG00374 family)
MRAALANANYLYLIPAIGVYFVSLYVRAFRWRYLLRPFAETRTNRLYPVIMVGYMANNILPMRLGELVRSYYLSTREPVRGTTALATILIERVLDGLTLLFILAVATLFLPVGGLADRISDSVGFPLWLLAVAVIVPFVSVLSLMVSAAMYPDLFLKAARRITGRLPERVSERAYGFTVRFIAGFEGIHRPSRLLTSFALSVPIWIAEGTMYYIIALGFDLQSDFDSVGLMLAAMLVLTASSNLATAIPSSQGSVGPFEFFAALSLVFLGVASGVASAYALVLHLALLLPVIVAGMAHLAYRGVSLGELTRGAPGHAVEGPDPSAASKERP